MDAFQGGALALNNDPVISSLQPLDGGYIISVLKGTFNVFSNLASPEDAMIMATSSPTHRTVSGETLGCFDKILRYAPDYASGVSVS